MSVACSNYRQFSVLKCNVEHVQLVYCNRFNNCGTVTAMMSNYSLTISYLGHRYGPITIDETASFLQLKRLLMELLVRQGLLRGEESGFHIVKIYYLSLIRELKTTIIPHEQSSIVSVVNRLLLYGPCSIDFNLSDFRKKPLRSAGQNSLIPTKTSINFVPKLTTNDSISNMIYWKWPVTSSSSESMFWLLSGMASIQGRLFRKIENGRRQESWREDWFMLVKDKIWVFSLTSIISNESKDILCPSFIDLGPNPEEIQVHLLDSSTFSVSKDIFRFAAVNSVGSVGEMANLTKQKDVFRAKSTIEAEKWILSIANYIQSYRDGTNTTKAELDNNIFELLDEDIKKEEYLRSEEFFNDIPATCFAFNSDDDTKALINILNNSTLRESFRTFLDDKGCSSVLLLWEHCEDFLRGHPNSPVPYKNLTNNIRILNCANTDIQFWFSKLDNIFKHVRLVLCNLDSPSHQEATAFEVHKQHCWKFLCGAVAEFVKSDLYRKAQLQMCFNMLPRRFPLSVDTIKKIELKEEPKSTLASLSSLLSFRVLTKAQPIVCSPSVESRVPKMSTIEATWRNALTATPLPNEWWSMICEDLQTSHQGLSYFLTSPRSCSKTDDGIAGLEYFFGNSTRSLGVVNLASVMRCCFVLNNNASRVRPVSLFMFGNDGENVEEKKSSAKLEIVSREQPDPESLLKDINRLQAGASLRFDESSPLANRSRSSGHQSIVSNKRLDDTSIRKLQWYEESFASLTISGWQRQIVVLSTLFGINLMTLLDPVSLSVSLQIRLEDVSKIGPSDKIVNVIKITDKSLGGYCLELVPDGSNDVEARTISSRWLNSMSTLPSLENTVRVILKRSYLQKRGRLNTAFKFRWFELCSDLKLRYFHDDSSRVFKGVIDLSLLQNSVTNPGVSRVDKELILNMGPPINRKWVLKGETERETEEWRLLILWLLNRRVESGVKDESLDDVIIDDDEDDDDDAEEVNEEE